MPGASGNKGELVWRSGGGERRRSMGGADYKPQLTTILEDDRDNDWSSHGSDNRLQHRGKEEEQEEGKKTGKRALR